MSVKMRGFFISTAVIALGVSAVLTSDASLAADASSLEACHETAEDSAQLKTCIGIMSARCIETEEGGGTTLGIVACARAEGRVWDRFLNLEYQATMKSFEKMDAEEAKIFPEFAKRAEKLRDAQRAWIAFRDAECGLIYAMWGSGSMRNVAYANCQMSMTAERMIELRDIGSEMR